MVVTKDTWLPEYDELTTPELNLSSPALKAGAVHFGKYCDFQSKEFMLCHLEENDPRKCLKEGKALTQCGIEFFNKVRRNCMQEFTEFWRCLDVQSRDMQFHECRKSQAVYNQCMSDKLGMETPKLGYFSKIRLHETQRPKPKLKTVELPLPDPEPPVLGDQPDPTNIPGSKLF